MKLFAFALAFLQLARGQTLNGTWGYEVANATYGVNYFYWFFEPQVTPTSTTPLVLWLTGPYAVNSAGTGTIPNQYGWNQNNYLLYVDQPGGTGFSTLNIKGYVTDEDQVAADMYTFLTNLFSSYPKLSKLPLFIIGESYAGHYVPAITSFLVQNAKEINVRGMAVGNGFIDPGIQTASFGPFIYSHGLMSASQLNAVQAAVPACQKDIARGDWQSAFNDCGNVLDLSLQYCSDNNGAQCNVYNIYAPCDGPLCYNFDNIVKFLNTPSVQKQLGVSGINWQACDTTPYEYLENDFDRSYLQDIPIVLAAGVPVTIYNGMLDIICNFYGEAAALDSMTWPGQSAFQKAANTTWVASGNTVGTYRTAQGLTYVAVANAGHMVPHDQPANALALLNTILQNHWGKQ